jgi:hypothetical protein
VSAYKIGGTPGPRALPCGVWPASPARTIQAGHAHQGRHPLASYVHTFTRELRMDTWRPIRAARARMQGPDASEQLRIDRAATVRVRATRSSPLEETLSSRAIAAMGHRARSLS